jgi:plastocyanin
MIDKAQIKAGDTIEWSFKQKGKDIYVNQVGIVTADGQGDLAVQTPEKVLWLVLQQSGLTVSKIIESAKK